MLKKIKPLLKSLFVVFIHLFRIPVTLEYPEKKLEQTKYFRGKLVADGNCVGCKVCERVCPSRAIKINTNENNITNSINIDMKKCIFCGNCTFYCRNNVLKMSKEYELASDNKNDLLLHYELNIEKGDTCDT